MRKLLLLIWCIGVLTLAGCSGAPDSSPEADPASSPSFEITSIDAAGMETLLAANKGKVVFLCFWSVSCPACKQEIPELETLAAKYSPDQLKLMLVNLDPTPESIAAFFGEQIPVTEQYHGSNDLAQAYGIYTIPHLVMYDVEGDVFLNKSGFFPAKMLDALVEHALRVDG
ncbi:MAG: redoxin domain-containing protein [Proteobacteria bacterium]|nr:redoxin domain-containing protein [Pseudomonadota bacterium]MBU1610860.1 redoxin domain-containing protein [Pseudomonadota bacterium]